MNTPLRLASDHTVSRERTMRLDACDEHGVEAAMRLKEVHGGSVVLVSMGPESAVDAMRRGLSMGADRAVLVTDPALHGADAWLTARVLAAVIEREQPDVVVCGTESADGSTGIVPPMVAELLHLPELTFASSMKASPAGDRLEIRREREYGHDVVEAPLPCLMTVTAAIGEPRYPTLRQILSARGREITRVTLADLDVQKGEPVEAIVSVEPVDTRRAGKVVIDENGSSIPMILSALRTAQAV